MQFEIGGINADRPQRLHHQRLSQVAVLASVEFAALPVMSISLSVENDAVDLSEIGSWGLSQLGELPAHSKHSTYDS